ncbi:hypothetical protein SISNIDRAFT_469309 [Sistotremastrum niveocremeum HHB9708]|uniref:Uncharacterized protein n=1 Tax=Sistotremastrum niveocremeum HHB9708 TaxID=1314777 RepID=A0A164QD68_9AGAM|nr:hypothetical protein SISNIDRAFT_469309 [Sistotremastrum niveocremeum HHB9708]
MTLATLSRAMFMIKVMQYGFHVHRNSELASYNSLRKCLRKILRIPFWPRPQLLALLSYQYVGLDPDATITNFTAPRSFETLRAAVRRHEIKTSCNESIETETEVDDSESILLNSSFSLGTSHKAAEVGSLPVRDIGSFSDRTCFRELITEIEASFLEFLASDGTNPGSPRIPLFSAFRAMIHTLQNDDEAMKLLNPSQIPDIAAWDQELQSPESPKNGRARRYAYRILSWLAHNQTVVDQFLDIGSDTYGNRKWAEILAIRELIKAVAETVTTMEKLILHCRLMAVKLPEDSFVRNMCNRLMQWPRALSWPEAAWIAIFLKERWDDQGREKASEHLRAVGIAAHRTLYKNNDSKQEEPFEEFCGEINEYSTFMKDYKNPVPIEFWDHWKAASLFPIMQQFARFYIDPMIADDARAS